jgi:hypothetical protein
VIERMVARLGLRERRGLGFQAETEPLRLHQVVITAKPYASTPSKSTTAADLVTGHGVALPPSGASRVPELAAALWCWRYALGGL